MRRPLTTATAVAAALALLLAACGDDDDTGTVATSTTETTEATSTTAPGDLPGERLELFPYEGAELAVVGVEADDTLNVRSGPGVDFPVAFELDPLASGIVATGHNRSLGDEGVWAEVESDGRTGWASTAFLLQPGSVDDITAEMYPLPADRPGAETMLELGQVVAAARASDEPPSRIVVVDGPTVGDLGEITVDVIGLGDDALGGERLHVFGEPLPDGETFQVRTVERTLLCTRGVDADSCV